MLFNLMKSWLSLLKKTISSWSSHKALRLSAALAYYSVFSIAPLLIIGIGIAGLVWGADAVTGRLYPQLTQFVGARAAEAVQSMIQSASKPTHGIWATVIGSITLLFGASGVLGALKDALNTVWEVKPGPDKTWLELIRDNFFNFGMVLVVGFLLMISLLLSATMAGVSKNAGEILSLPPAVWSVIVAVVSLAMITVLLALIFKMLPDAKIRWTDVWLGAFVTALLFEAGKSALGWYLGLESTSSSYGAAASVVLLLLWVYYAACIVLFGAEFTRMHALSRGHHMPPAADAVPTTADEQRAQGMNASSPVTANTNVVAAPGLPHDPLPPRHKLLGPMLKYLEGRGMLLSLEAREAMSRILSLLIVVVGILIALFAIWLLVTTALVGLLTTKLGWAWIGAALAVAGLHVLLVAGAGWYVWHRFKTSLWFADTLNQLRKDRQWLKKGTTNP